jgi:hypothetical protein
MATVTGYTAAKMQEIEGASIVNGSVVDGDLILYKQDGTPINAGPVRGPQGIQGPDGDLTDAPSDGKIYLRKDGAWYILAPTAPPSDGFRYTLKNGAWESLPADPPSDSNKYALENGVWVRADRPWKLEFNSVGPTPPAGFSVGTVMGATTWGVKFSGSGYNVNYEIYWHQNGIPLEASTTRFTFPAALRPVFDTDEQIFSWVTSPGGLTRVTLAMYGFNADGTIKGAKYVTGMGGSQSSMWGTPPFMAEDPYQHRIHMTGSFTRSSTALPSTAAYV